MTSSSPVRDNDIVNASLSLEVITLEAFKIDKVQPDEQLLSVTRWQKERE